MNLPAGFRFNPFENELINLYLKPKVRGEKLSCNVIEERQLYGSNSNPWQVFDPKNHPWILSEVDHKRIISDLCYNLISLLRISHLCTSITCAESNKDIPNLSNTVLCKITLDHSKKPAFKLLPNKTTHPIKASAPEKSKTSKTKKTNTKKLDVVCSSSAINTAVVDTYGHKGEEEEERCSLLEKVKNGQVTDDDDMLEHVEEERCVTICQEKTTLLATPIGDAPVT